MRQARTGVGYDARVSGYGAITNAGEGAPPSEVRDFFCQEYFGTNSYGFGSNAPPGSPAKAICLRAIRVEAVFHATQPASWVSENKIGCEAYVYSFENPDSGWSLNNLSSTATRNHFRNGALRASNYKVVVSAALAGITPSSPTFVSKMRTICGAALNASDTAQPYYGGWYYVAGNYGPQDVGNP